MTLLRWLTFLLGSQIVSLTVLVFWIYLFLLTLVFVQQWLSLDWEILIMLLSQFPLTFQQTQNSIAYDYSHADWDGLCNHLRDVTWENIFKLSASTAPHEFCEWVQVGIDVYILFGSHSSPWLSAACAAAILHRNHFFICTNRIALLNLKQCSDKLELLQKGS